VVALLAKGRSTGSSAIPAKSVLVEPVHSLVGNPVLASLEIIKVQRFMRTDPQSTNPTKALTLLRALDEFVSGEGCVVMDFGASTANRFPSNWPITPKHAEQSKFFLMNESSIFGRTSVVQEICRWDTTFCIEALASIDKWEGTARFQKVGDSCKKLDRKALEGTTVAVLKWHGWEQEKGVCWEATQAV